MNTELKRFVNITVHGQDKDDPHFNRSLIISDAQMFLPLPTIRDIILSQGVEFPCNKYLFLTCSGSPLSKKQEEMLRLTDVCTSLLDGVEKDIRLLSAEEIEKVFHFKMTVLPVTEETQDNGTPEEETPNIPESSETQQPPHFLCPFREFKHVINLHDYLNVKTMVKILIALTLALAATVLMIICTFQMMTTAWSVLDLGHLRISTSSSNDDIMGLKLKLQQVELQSSHKVQELEKRLLELEDMYLRDLKLQVQEMAELKASLSFKQYRDQPTWTFESQSNEEEVNLEKLSTPDMKVVLPDGR